ncbi:hypothetical protein K0M31_004794 [Melipona bicolor]|uniref:snRNA-activating protein complex subunit 4 n=1 Tax=Melipona bicolor TaxID=60889 RepID=A0AA40FW25_9HYME|nr:hypothetical protein K0M31_004794 [Melipona bicolor]
MNTVLNEDDENLAEILLLESILDNEDHFKNNYEANDTEFIGDLQRDTVKNRVDALENNTDDEFTERNIENCNRMLDLNKQIISSLMDLKRDITFALAKCEQKLKAIECSLDTHTVGNKKILIYNAGMPYFKDKRYFSASNNEDEILKENYKELQLKNLPKISAWTRKERDTLLRAVTKEMEREKEEKAKFSSMDALEEMSLPREKEFDWFRISSVYFEEVHSPFDCCVMWNVYLHPDINRKRWTKSEDINLRKIAKKYQYQDWDKIARELNTNRTAYQCLIRYNTTKKLPKVQCTWQDREDKRLSKLVEIFQIGDFIPWGQVTNWMRSRTKQQVYFRWSYSLAPYLTKGRFTKIEDNTLRNAVTKYGTNFHKISAILMPNRSTVQLHDRYQTLTINQNQKRNSWTFEEDTKLLDLFKRVGPNWSTIAKQFSGKTRTYLRHRYKALQKYIKRGVSVFKLHGYLMNNGYNDEHNEYSENETEQVFCTSELDNSITNKDCDNDIIDIDQKLIEYFHTKRKVKELMDRWEFYDMEKLECNTISLYNILQALDAKLCISNDISRKLNNRNQQLLHSLREYMKIKNDKKMYFEIIEKYKSRMFGKNELAQDSSFIPIRSSGSKPKLKNLSNCIDYYLNKNDRFIFQVPINFNTPEVVISYIGGDEQELQFQKFSRSFQINSTKCSDSALKTRNCPTFLTERLLKQCCTNNSSDKNNSTDKLLIKVNSIVCSNIGAVAPLENGSNDGPQRLESQNKCQNTKTCIKNNRRGVLCDNLEDYSSSNCNTDIIIQKHNIPTEMYVSYATLLSLKNLTYVKQLNEKYHIPDKYFMRSKEFQEAFNLLETRLEKLFKYPLGLSKVSLPEVYVAYEPEVLLCSKKKKRKDNSDISHINQT